MVSYNIKNAVLLMWLATETHPTSQGLHMCTNSPLRVVLQLV